MSFGPASEYDPRPTPRIRESLHTPSDRRTDQVVALFAQRIELTIARRGSGGRFPQGEPCEALPSAPASQTAAPKRDGLVEGWRGTSPRSMAPRDTSEPRGMPEGKPSTRRWRLRGPLAPACSRPPKRDRPPPKRWGPT